MITVNISGSEMKFLSCVSSFFSDVHSSFSNSLPEFNGINNLLFFYYAKFTNSIKDILKVFSEGVPSKALYASKRMFVILYGYFSTKVSAYPFHKILIGVCNCESSCINRVFSYFSSAFFYGNSPFSIDYSSKINKAISTIHNIPLNFVNDMVKGTILFINNHRERLNERTPACSGGCESLNSDRKTERRIRRVLPAIVNMVTKVTEMTWVEINEQVDLTSQSPVLNQRAMLLGRSMRFTEDDLIRDMLATTAFAIFAVGGVNGDAPTEMALSDVQDVVKTLLSNDAKPVSSSIEGTNRFGTAPIPNAYIGLSHTDLSSTLENMNGFVGTHQYSNQRTLDMAEWGTVGRVRFLLSSRGSVTANSSALGEDVYNTLICGMEAYTTVGLENSNAKFIYHDYKLAGGPLELNSTGAWKMAHASAITNDAWIANLKSTLA